MSILKYGVISFQLIMIGILLNSCAENKEEKESVTDKVLTPVMLEEDEEDISADYEFIPPSTLQVASIFKKAGLVYDVQLTNPRNRVSEYSTKFTQSLAFGVYSSDLAYSVMHEKYDEASEFLKTLRNLGGEIGLETVFDSKDLVSRFETNIGNQDSIIDILIFIQENTDDYIEENGKVDLSVIYYTGAWIEGMYMGANTVMKDQEKKVGVLISEQMTIAEILLKGLKHVKDQNDDIIDLIDVIKDLVDTYYTLDSVKELGEEADYIDIILSTDEIILMSGKIVELRESVVQ